MSAVTPATADFRAVSILYQALVTGCVLTLVTRRGETMAAELVFRLFGRQPLEYLGRLARAQGEAVNVDESGTGVVVRQQAGGSSRGWRRCPRRPSRRGASSGTARSPCTTGDCGSRPSGLPGWGKT